MKQNKLSTLTYNHHLLLTRKEGLKYYNQIFIYDQLFPFLISLMLIVKMRCLVQICTNILKNC